MDGSITQVGLSVETKIPLLDGRDLSITELLAEFGSEQTFWVYSCDENHNVTPGLAHVEHAAITCTELIKVTLDNDEWVVCSPESLFVLRTGEFACAKDLQSETSLMPLYRKIDEKLMKGYEMVMNPRTRRWQYTHRVSASKDGRYKGDVVHHVNFNKRDNRPDNLQVMSWEEHTLLHSQYTDLLNTYATSEGGRSKSREVMSKNWSDEEWREKMIEINRANGASVSQRLTAEGRNGFQAVDKSVHAQRMRERAIARNAHEELHTPEARRKRAETRRRRLLEDEEYAKKMHDQAVKNLASYNELVANGEIKPNERQVVARRENMRKLRENKEMMKMNQRKTTWRRFHQDKYPTFEEYLQSLEEPPNNHKVATVETVSDIPASLFRVVVDKHCNFAVLAGAFIQGN